MSFWDNTEKPQGGTYESGGGGFEPIPAGTQVLFSADEAAWAEYDGVRYINIKWTVLEPAEYKNRIVFQKMYPLNNHPQNKDPAAKGAKDRAMLAAIDQNASGGKLMELGREPTDMDLAANICARPMMGKLAVWETEDKSKSGNWVQAVAPKGSGVASTPQQPSLPNAEPDNNIPF